LKNKQSGKKTKRYMVKKTENNHHGDNRKNNTSFFEDVWDVVRQIPKGRVTSYGAIANYLGTRMSARMVGWAMNAAHTIADVPAQRVVNRNGMLSGKAHFGSPDRMQELLEADGLEINEDTVVDFKQLFWDPATELGL
jgi:methylated-DNA-protein-cysteine methyltransferase-like protein